MTGAKGKQRKKKRVMKPDNPAQSAQFVASAKRLGLGGKGESFDNAMDKLLGKPKRG